ncbi:hypothetical protein A0257_09055 [Hymenobacter psoromatis]|nr:hypothetical protein A0257_09055 [Hymenobacter psoromatis]
MNRSQNARLKRHQKYNQVLLEATAEIATVPAFADLVATYQQELARLLPALGSQQRQTSAGATEIKDDLSAALIPGVVRCASALLLLFKKEGDLEAARSLHIHRSDYSRLSGPALAAEAADVLRLARQRLPDLQPYAITAADLTTLETAAAAFAAALPAPKLSIEQRKISGLTFRNALKATDDFLTEELQAGTELLADAHPLLYARLKEARRIDDASYGKSAAAKLRREEKQALGKDGAAPTGG